MIQVKVAILDDEIKDIERVKKYFVSISNQYLNFNCDEYLEVEEKFYNQYDLYVVDIELNNCNGLEISKIIKERCPQAVLIINSKRNDLVFESFRFGVFFFIRKDHFEIDMKFASARLLEHFKSTKQVYMYKQKQMSIEIPYEKIMVIEKVGNNIEIHLSDGRKLTENKSMKQILSEIKSNNFIQCHQSYLVNLSYVLRIEESDFVLKNDKVQISRRYLKKTKEAYIHYLNKKA